MFNTVTVNVISRGGGGGGGGGIFVNIAMHPILSNSFTSQVLPLIAFNAALKVYTVFLSSVQIQEFIG